MQNVCLRTTRVHNIRDAQKINSKETAIHNPQSSVFYSVIAISSVKP